eukprot:Gb_09456 [translate_table: standard]
MTSWQPSKRWQPSLWHRPPVLHNGVWNCTFDIEEGSNDAPTNFGSSIVVGKGRIETPLEKYGGGTKERKRRKDAIERREQRAELSLIRTSDTSNCFLIVSELESSSTLLIGSNTKDFPLLSFRACNALIQGRILGLLRLFYSERKASKKNELQENLESSEREATGGGVDSNAQKTKERVRIEPGHKGDPAVSQGLVFAYVRQSSRCQLSGCLRLDNRLVAFGSYQTVPVLSDTAECQCSSSTLNEGGLFDASFSPLWALLRMLHLRLECPPTFLCQPSPDNSMNHCSWVLYVQQAHLLHFQLWDTIVFASTSTMTFVKRPAVSGCTADGYAAPIHVTCVAQGHSIPLLTIISSILPVQALGAQLARSTHPCYLSVAGSLSLHLAPCQHSSSVAQLPNIYRH